MKRILYATLLSTFLSCPVMSTHQAEEESLEGKTQRATTQKNTKKKDKKKKQQATITSLAKEKPKPKTEINNIDERKIALGIYIDRTQKAINMCVASTATKAYGLMNTNWSYAAPGEKLTTTSPYWEATYIKGRSLQNGVQIESSIPTLILKTKPDNLMEALDNLVTKPASLECTIALSTAKILALREILGKKYFHNFASSFYNLLKRTPNASVEEFFHELPLQFIKTIPGKAIPGSIGYITNIPHYSTFKPGGNARGDNLFCVNDDAYQCFYPSEKGGLDSLAELEAHYFEEFAKPEDVECEHAKHAKIAELFKTTPDLFHNTRRKAQENLNFHQIFDKEEIDSFVKTGEVYSFAE